MREYIMIFHMVPPTEEYGCPLCPRTYDDGTALRVHLEVSHRKSELSAYVLDVLEPEGDRRLELPA